MPTCSECGQEILSGIGFSYPYLPENDPDFAPLAGKFFCSERCSKKFRDKFMQKINKKWWDPFGYFVDKYN